MHAQIASDLSDRPLALKRQPNTSLNQLPWILPSSWHRRRLSSPQDRILAQQPPSNPAWLSVRVGGVSEAFGFDAPAPTGRSSPPDINHIHTPRPYWSETNSPLRKSDADRI
jgi:hypothetical protein